MDAKIICKQNEVYGVKNRIKEVREQIRMSQAEFGDILNMAQSQVSRLEDGLVYPNIFTICSIADIFQIDLNWLLFGRGDINMIKEHESMPK